VRVFGLLQCVSSGCSRSACLRVAPARSACLRVALKGVARSACLRVATGCSAVRVFGLLDRCDERGRPQCVSSGCCDERGRPQCVSSGCYPQCVSSGCYRSACLRVATGCSAVRVFGLLCLAHFSREVERLPNLAGRAYTETTQPARWVVCVDLSYQNEMASLFVRWQQICVKESVPLTGSSDQGRIKRSWSSEASERTKFAALSHRLVRSRHVVNQCPEELMKLLGPSTLPP
jgi:hypothetical protein